MGADSNVYSRSLRQIGIGARSLLSGALDGLSLGLAKPGTTLSDYLGLPKPEKGTPEELVSGLIRGAADMAPAQLTAMPEATECPEWSLIL